MSSIYLFGRFKVQTDVVQLLSQVDGGLNKLSFILPNCNVIGQYYYTVLNPYIRAL
jgi:hypothetical protein